MKMLSWLFVAFITLAVSACQTTQSDSTTPGQNLVGNWKGNWTADSGSSGAFGLKVLRVSKGGRIIARRSSPAHDSDATEEVTMGKINGNMVELDRGKGKGSWIKLSLQKMDGGHLGLSGRYSTMAGKKGKKTAVMGKIMVKKAK